MSRSHELNLTAGSVFKELIVFSLPILGVNILQLLFSTADTVVLGRFAAESRATLAVGAVGATASLTSLLIGFFIGIALGANVMVAKSKGAQDMVGARKYVGSSVLLSLIAGSVLLIIGYFGAETFLTWLNCKDELLEMATTYLKIYFLGMPVIMFYNFAAAILRAVGDTLRPLIFIIIGGVLNLGLNIFFVTVVGLDVSGVAIATVASNAVSAVCCLIVMLKSKGYARLEFKYMRFYKRETHEILYVGVPSGLQKVFFCFANVLVASNVNALGYLATSGNAVAHELERYVQEGGEAIAISSLSFTSQNMGAGNLDRIKETIKKSIVLILAYNFVVGGLSVIFSATLCMAVRNDPEILPFAQTRLIIMASFFFVANIMGVFGYVMRGMGKSVTSMIISLFGGCVLRIIFIYVTGWFFPENYTVIILMYPVTWTITVIIQMFFVKKIFADTRAKIAKIAKTNAI
ncbi:MAG: MATE family efflux transporter [Clostridia bacterium]|nr:MATE family efflux transporter [Clostridia bacterium]